MTNKKGKGLPPRGVPESPNYIWTTNGYRVERRRGKFGKIRKIYCPQGKLILNNVGYNGELAEIEKRGLL